MTYIELRFDFKLLSVNNSINIQDFSRVIFNKYKFKIYVKIKNKKL